MKRALFLITILLASPAIAQQMSPEQLQAQYLYETGQLRQALGQAQSQIIQLRKELEAAKKSTEPSDEPKK